MPGEANVLNYQYCSTVDHAISFESEFSPFMLVRLIYSYVAL